jgi:hypothetical protein
VLLVRRLTLRLVLLAAVMVAALVLATTPVLAILPNLPPGTCC